MPATIPSSGIYASEWKFQWRLEIFYAAEITSSYKLPFTGAGIANKFQWKEHYVRCTRWSLWHTCIPVLCDKLTMLAGSIFFSIFMDNNFNSSAIRVWSQFLKGIQYLNLFFCLCLSVLHCPFYCMFPYSVEHSDFFFKLDQKKPFWIIYSLSYLLVFCAFSCLLKLVFSYYIIGIVQHCLPCTLHQYLYE